jgi:hypothetical protein
MEAEEVINYQREALLRLLMGLFASAGLVADGASVATLPKPMRLLILRVLLPAESAVRRLAYYLALRMPRVAAAVRKRRGAAKGGNRKKAGLRAPSFWLFDRRKFFPELSSGKRVVRGPGPNIRLFDEPRGYRPPEPPAPRTEAERETEVSRRLCRRMQALLLALKDMPAQARRMQRAMDRRAQQPPGPKRYGPVRSGFPPGYRPTRPHEVDELLYECHRMAWVDRPPPEP